MDSMNLDDIAVFTESLPNDVYDAKLLNIEPATTKAGDPQLKVTFEVTTGSFRGQTQTKFYFLKVLDGKRGAWCPGLGQIKRDAQELGVYEQLPKQFPLDPKAARAAYAKAFSNKRMRIAINDGKPNKEGKSYKEVSILSGVTSTEQVEAEDDETVA